MKKTNKLKTSVSQAINQKELKSIRFTNTIARLTKPTFSYLSKTKKTGNLTTSSSKLELKTPTKSCSSETISSSVSSELISSSDSSTITDIIYKSEQEQEVKEDKSKLKRQNATAANIIQN